MSSGVFDRGLNQHAGNSLAALTSSKIIWQLEVEMVSPIMICLPSHGACFERRHIHAGGFHCTLATRDWVSKKVIGAHRPAQLVARPITSRRFFILPAKINGDLEFRENISIHVQC